MTYATHQEAASRALRDLLNQDHNLDPASTSIVLECREQALGAIRQRLRHLGDGYEPGDGDVNFRIRSVADRPLFHLSKLVHALHSTGPGTIAPSDLLPGPPATTAESVTDRWRCVARELMLGTAELTRADSQPWTFKPEAGWYVVADVAETVAAVAALDLVLANTGALPKASPLEGMTRLLVAGRWNSATPENYNEEAA